MGLKKKTLLLVILVFGLVLAACSNDSASEGGGDSIGKAVDYKIVGIEPGAGIMQATEKALEEYDNLADWNLVESSSSAMATELQKAIEKQEPIIVTGWTPHWMFAKFDLKYLEDPKGIYGESESLGTFVRKGLKDDQPSAYKVLDQFYWEPEDMEEVMVNIHDGTEPEEAAASWVEANSDKVAEWTKGAEKVNGEKISLAYVAWDSEIASTNVVGKVLEDLGYKVELIQLDAGPMFAAVAEGDADAMVSAWLPVTHASYIKQYGDQLENLGENLEGAKTGLVVPSYVDIDSIEELK
ncbi:glycine betaine ABC transporter substrate-binding protein [Caldifermentibacillus hisashii]|uniref:glycine betaine ABC transporter substrate-binding protein n=1 Tax=Caldifermentibacillus hisashii TaxID=996558 RepID=UPI002E214705|nr:glycine betaine ABC transporter substrate-binding protein [Caldifermentibacillus hisashii]MDL0419274.1 glycine betaine ABC transporter substrate-binding protein [Caldibacillus thermoamylovorans]MED3644259.1 glycine betaine ABC transporter substrate-binding protein [Caldifermentibacillus hisashii]MED4850862.1 glycine betaine ABC transporter substrate-binding protein [Caldifermentibacillus hisashii]